MTAVGNIICKGAYIEDTLGNKGGVFAFDQSENRLISILKDSSFSDSSYTLQSSSVAQSEEEVFTQISNAIYFDDDREWFYSGNTINKIGLKGDFSA